MPTYDNMIEALCTQSFCLIDDFLPASDYQGLKNHLLDLQHQQQLQPAGIGRNAQQNQVIRKDLIHWIDEQTANHAEASYLDAMHEMAAQFNRHLFTGLDTYECHYAVYQPNSFYKKHVDQFQGNQDRQISCVLYLNENWQNEEGGQLRLYNEQDEPITEINPTGNRLICFRSHLPHEVLTAQKTRRSIAGWFKVRQQ